MTSDRWSRHGRGELFEQRGDGEIGVIDKKNVLAVIGRELDPFLHDDGGGAGLGEIAQVFVRAEEGEILIGRVGERSEAADGACRLGRHGGVENLREFRKRHAEHWRFPTGQ